GQRELAEAAARARAEQPHVGRDLRERERDAAQRAARLHAGVARTLRLEVVLRLAEPQTGGALELGDRARREFRRAVQPRADGPAPRPRAARRAARGGGPAPARARPGAPSPRPPGRAAPASRPSSACGRASPRRRTPARARAGAPRAPRARAAGRRAARA